jgi:putative redox protein
MMAEVIVSSAGYLKQEMTAGPHRLVADEPVEAGGSGAGPDPYSYLLAALGACTAMTLQMYARHKGFPLEKVEVSLRNEQLHAKDCEECESREGKITRIDRFIAVSGPLTEDQKKRLLEIAQRCPVHRTLTSEIVIKDQMD